MMRRFAADNPSTLSCIIRLKAQVGVIGGVLIGFVTGIHKDSVRRWNLWFPSAGVFAEVLAGRATGTQITFPHVLSKVNRLLCDVSCTLNVSTLQSIEFTYSTEN